MEESLKNYKVVPYDLFQERLEKVKELKSADNHAYYLYKDSVTGEHFVYYTYLHLNVAEGGQEERFRHLLPIESDDVLAILFDDKPYDFPEHWTHAFLRSGSEGNLMWFDPGEAELHEQYERKAIEAKDKLAGFKQGGEYDDESIRKLLEEMEKMFEDK